MWIAVVLVSVCLVGQSLAGIDDTVMKCIRDKGLTEFAQMLLDTDISVELRGDGPFTVFAPSNDAIANMDVDVAAALAKESVLLKQVVQYHIIEEYMITLQLAQSSPVNTMEGQEVKIERKGETFIVNNQSSLLTGDDDTNIICLNGILHIVDTVIIPPVFSVNNIAAVLITRDDLFRDMFMALLLNNLTHILEESEFTLFAPTDLGFGRYSQIQEVGPRPNAPEIFTEIFKYHMVPGRRTTHQLTDGQRLYTYHGYPIDITLDGGDILVDHAKVVEKDIPASNGVIHGIDHILFPEDLLDMLIQG